MPVHPKTLCGSLDWRDARMTGRWSERRDLNPRPFGPEPNALPDCATLRRCFQTCQAENRCEVYYFLSQMSIGGVECCRGECCQLETGNWDWQQWQHFIWCACAQPRKPAGGRSPCGDLNEGTPPHGLRLRLAVCVAPSLSPVGPCRTAGFRGRAQAHPTSSPVPQNLKIRDKGAGGGLNAALSQEMRRIT